MASLDSTLEKHQIHSLVIWDIFSVEEIFTTGCVIPRVLDDPDVVNSLAAASYPRTVAPGTENAN